MAQPIRPQNKQIVDPETGRISLEWDAYFARLEQLLATQLTGGVTSFEGRTGVVVATAGDYTASEITNVPAGNIAAITVQAAIDELDTEKQPVDATLTALAGINTNGLLTQTATDTFTGRTLTGPAAGISVSNGDGVAGNPTLALANDLSALEGLASTGIATRTGADSWAQRTITGTANEISVSNGDGVSGNPALSLPSTVDLSGKTSLAIPVSAAPTVDANGEIALDTTVTDFSHGIVKYWGGEELGVVAMPIAQFTTPTDGHLVTYDATNDEFKLAAPAGGGTAGLVLLNSGTFSGASTLDIILTSYTSYRGLKLLLTDVLPATDGHELVLRVSTNGGSTYDSGASDYRWVLNDTSDNGAGAGSPTLIARGSTADTLIQLATNIGNSTAEGAKGEITILNQTNTTRNTNIYFDFTHRNNSGSPAEVVRTIGSGTRVAAQDTDAIRLAPANGSSITSTFSGAWALYGFS